MKGVLAHDRIEVIKCDLVTVRRRSLEHLLDLIGRHLFAELASDTPQTMYCYSRSIIVPEKLINPLHPLLALRVAQIVHQGVHESFKVNQIALCTGLLLGGIAELIGGGLESGFLACCGCLLLLLLLLLVMGECLLVRLCDFHDHGVNGGVLGPHVQGSCCRAHFSRVCLAVSIGTAEETEYVAKLADLLLA